MPKSYVIVGGGGFGREVMCWALDACRGSADAVRGFVDDDPARAADPKAVSGVPYLGTIDGFTVGADDVALLAIAGSAARRAIAARLGARSVRTGSLVHPTAVVAASATLGEGVILCPLSLVSAGAVVGRYVIVNAASTVGHDTVIGDFTTLSSHVDITGAVIVGEDVMMGSGACVLPGVSIGARCVIGAGAVVVRSTPDGVTMYSSPAKRLL
jgi:sugar O-acyltransferase (sialic acid O-acetyltransferase NeuD family)